MTCAGLRSSGAGFQKTPSAMPATIGIAKAHWAIRGLSVDLEAGTALAAVASFRDVEGLVGKGPPDISFFPKEHARLPVVGGSDQGNAGFVAEMLAKEVKIVLVKIKAGPSVRSIPSDD